MSLKDQVTHELEGLSEADLGAVADFLAFLKFRARIHSSVVVDEVQLETLYAEFADEDRELAEAGIADYATALADEDRQ